MKIFPDVSSSTVISDLIGSRSNVSYLQGTGILWLRKVLIQILAGAASRGGPSAAYWRPMRGRGRGGSVLLGHRNNQYSMYQLYQVSINRHVSTIYP